jgi:hypothetical protein
LSVTLGSLLTDDLKALQELDLLPSDSDAEDLRSRATQQEQQDASPAVPVHPPQEPEQETQAVTRSQRSGRTGGLSWFEELLEGSRLGRKQNTRRGHGVSSDGSTLVEWEVSEYFDDETQQPDPGQPKPTSSKRKIDDIALSEQGDDVKMHG